MLFKENGRQRCYCCDEEKKSNWQCRTSGCVKQAQSGRDSRCKRCYNEFVRNQPLIDLTQGAENLASLGDSVNNEGTRAGINENISYDNAICFNDATGSLQRGATSIDGFGADNNTSVLNKCGTSVEQDQCEEVAFDNKFGPDAKHAAEQFAVVDVANVHPSTSSLS